MAMSRKQITADGFLESDASMVARSPLHRLHRVSEPEHSGHRILELATGKRWTLVSWRGLNITPALSPMEISFRQ